MGNPGGTTSMLSDLCLVVGWVGCSMIHCVGRWEREGELVCGLSCLGTWPAGLQSTLPSISSRCLTWAFPDQQGLSAVL